jgi:hypothetical protein
VAVAVADMLDARRHRGGLPEARTSPTSRPRNSERSCGATSSQTPRREPGPHRRALAGTPG